MRCFFMNLIFFILILLSLQLSYAQSDSLSKLTDKDFPPIEFESYENKAFWVGEKLTFGIYYQFIRVGTAEMEIVDTVLVNGKKTIHIQTKARSAGFFDNFYKVRDEINTYLDPQGFFSRKFVKKLREGDYYVDVILNYDYEKRTIYGEKIRYDENDIKKVREKDSKKYEVELTKPLFDVLASFYFSRLQRLEPGMPVYVESNDNDKIYPITIFVQKYEVEKTDAGKFKTIKISPKLRGDAVFKQEGAIWIWLTNDQFKIPVKVESELYFGSIYVELEKIQGHKLPLPSQLK